MDFNLSAEQVMVRDLCRNLAKNEIMPIAEELDKTGQSPYEVWKKMGNLGICGIPFSEECGGWGLDWLSMIIAVEEISRGDASFGYRFSETRELIFDDCRIPKEDILGNPDKGISQFLMALQTGRIGFAAHSVGLAQAILDVSLLYAREREQFGRPIGKFQAVRFKLADMVMEVELARLMTYKAAWQKDRGENYFATSSFAKIFASETAKRCADNGVQIHGGYELMDEYPIPRYWREVKFEEILEGTSEIQRLNIARRVLKL